MASTLKKFIEELWEPIVKMWFTEEVDDPRITAKRIRAAIPTANLVIIPEAGHFPFLEQRDRFFAETEAWLAWQGLAVH